MVFAEALIPMGRIGVKAWIFKKELFKKTREDLMEEVKLIPKEQIEEIAAAVQVPAVAPVDEKAAPEEEELLPEDEGGR